MRIILLSIICFLLFEAPPLGCSLFDNKIPPEAYPEQIGEFKRGNFPVQITDAVNFHYVKRNADYSTSLSLDLRLVKNSEEAKSYLNLSSCDCSAEKRGEGFGEPKLLLEQDVKDRSGKSKGIIRLCQTFYGEHKNYHLEMANDDLVMQIRTINQASDFNKTRQLSLKDVIEFAKNIPHNANLDFESLTVEE